MDATTFNGISRNLSSVATRRSMFRLLGGAAALGAGVALAVPDETLGKNRGKGRSQGRNQGKGHDHEGVSAQGKGKGKKLTICYQNQTLSVKKKDYQNKYPGATTGACPTGPNPGGNPGGTPVMCTSFILSGGPNQSDPILIDDDGSIANVTTGKFLIIDNNGMSGPLNPVVFSGQVGDVLRVRATDWGGCRSFSPLWVHCLATGQKRQLFTGYSGAGCSYPKGEFLDMNLTLAL